MAEMYRMEKDQIKDALADSMDFFKRDIIVRKVIDMLYDEAEVSKVAAHKAEVTEEVKEEEKTEE
jgi:trigger factor